LKKDLRRKYICLSLEQVSDVWIESLLAILHQPVCFVLMGKLVVARLVKLDKGHLQLRCVLIDHHKPIAWIKQPPYLAQRGFDNAQPGFDAGTGLIDELLQKVLVQNLVVYNSQFGGRQEICDWCRESPDRRRLPQ
jgi:hypothetical protein